MAACPPPFQADDQTDEDFFDKLVVDDDVSGITGSHSESSTMARAFSNLSIGDEDAGFAAEGDDQEENKTLQSFDAPKNEVSSDSFDFKEGGESLGPEEKKTDLGLTEVTSLGPSMGGGGGSKGTGVKVVQWSSFNVDSQQFDLVGFGSDSDFLTENLDGSASKMNWDDGSKYVFPENPTASSEQQNKQYYGLANEQITNVNDYQYWENPIASSEQQDAHFYGSTNEQTTDMNDSQYWEKVYPGWKYDLSTGQWYQTDGFDSNTNAQSENYNVASGNMQESYEDKIQAAGDGVVLDQRSEISYLQQTTKSVVGTVADISNYSQVSQGSTEYPPNMVFNPQYPEWYYDTNTQQWYSLKSYYKTVQTTAGAVQDQPSQVNAWDGFISKEHSDIYNEDGHSEQNTIQGFSENQDTGRDWDGSASNYVQHNTWQPDPSVKSVMAFAGNQQIGSFYSSMGHAVNYTDQQIGFKAFEPVQSIGYDSIKGATRFQSFVPSESVQQFSQPKGEQSLQEHLSHSYFANQSSVGYSQKQFQGTNASNSQFSYTNEGRSSAGRPPHALVTFGFGGKLIVMKDGSSLGTKLDYGSQDTVGGAVSIFSLMEVLMDKTDALSSMNGDCSYFHALCQQSFPGPLVGGNAAAKDVNKWIDEMITHCESSVIDVRKGEQLRLLHSLLKISCQHYGKLRSTFGADPSVEETDGPESAVTKLFASARTNSARQREYGSFTHCMQNLPPEGQIRTTAVEVQNLLVSGRRKEALHCAQAGQLWGPALVLAAQLGEKFYVDTVKQMTQRQFVFGSPLRTLCLLIAGQPADVFSANSSANNSLSGAVTAPQQPTEIGMLDDWEENLAIITANRTKDDELVMVHLGDCLWKERGEITAAHTCYLVAEANFESYSDSARLCLIGADHWKCPRTYASPEAIQRTELYEYSKVLGNSQFILLQFQPYKLVYAYMLAEVGKISDSLRYCQASLKLLKNSGRAPEVEMWKSLLSSLEERLRTHQQGGYSTNLAPAKLVGKLFTSIDRSIHRMMGAPTSPLPPVPQRSVNGKESYSVPPKVANSQSTMAMSSLVPSASVEGISDWTGDRTRKSMHSRSISEPDFGRSPKQDSSKDASSADAQGKVSPSRFGRIGSHLLQKTMGWVSRSGHQAKLGESNKFYYDEKLKRWVEEGAEPPAEEADLPPPPTASSFQNGTPGYNINSAFKSPGFTANGALEAKFPIPQEHSSGIPPISPNPNQFSARGRMGVRSRYVDTFNKGGGGTPLANSFQSPSAPSVKPGVGAKFFVPTTPAVSEKQTVDVTAGESNHEAAANGEPSASAFSEAEASFYSPSPPPPPSAMQRFPSMDNIPSFGNMGTTAALQNGNGSHSSHSRAASWCGSYGEMHSHKMAEVEPLGDGLGAPSSFMPSKPSTLIPSSSPLQPNGGSWGDDLHEVAL